MNLLFQVDDVDFPLDEDPGDDEKGLTALYKLSELTGVVLRETKNNNAVVPKDQWEQRGVLGGYVRLAFVPVSVTQAACYAYVYPAPEEELQEMLRKHELSESFSGLPMIQLGNTNRVNLFPRETSAMKAGFGLIPFIGVNAAPDVEVTLPDSDALKRETAGTLRSVGVPKVLKLEQWKKAIKTNNPPPADRPTVIWPEFRASGNQMSVHGEYNNVPDSGGEEPDHALNLRLCDEALQVCMECVFVSSVLVWAGPVRVSAVTVFRSEEGLCPSPGREEQVWPQPEDGHGRPQEPGHQGAVPGQGGVTCGSSRCFQFPPCS